MRVLLAPGVDRRAVDALACARGWRLGTILARTESRPRQLVFATADGESIVTLVEDHRIDARYLVVLGHDPEPVAGAVRAALPCLDEPAVRAMLELEGQRARALCWLGVVAPEHASEPLLTMLREALSSDDRAIRDAARFAAEASGWPELREHAASDVPGAPPRPERPRLAASVQARLNLVDAAPKIILNDVRTGMFLEIDLESYRALELADGTRDLDALSLALADRGAYRGEADLAQLLCELDDVGALVDGLDVPAPAPPVPAPATAPDRPLDVLPFTLVCDGRGSCCRFYGSVAFTPREARRALVVAEAMDLPIGAEQLFTPVSGAQLREDDVRAVAQIDGRCAFLDREGLCGLHRQAGPEAKPFACRLYPAMFMDDGEVVRVSLGPECACIFASEGRTGGAPLVPLEARTLADLGPGVHVMHVPDPVPLSRARAAPRAELAAFSRALTSALAGGAIDAVALAWTLADRMDAEGLSLDGLERALGDAAPPPVDRVAPWLAAMAERARDAASTHESWRSASDLSRRVARWIADALGHTSAEVLIAEADDPAAERFYLRTLAHGHRLAIEGRTLEHGLRDRVARMLAARAMARLAGPDDTSTPYPLALLEAAVRNLGMSGYADELLDVSAVA